MQKVTSGLLLGGVAICIDSSSHMLLIYADFHQSWKPYDSFSFSLTTSDFDNKNLAFNFLVTQIKSVDF